MGYAGSGAGQIIGYEGRVVRLGLPVLAGKGLNIEPAARHLLPHVATNESDLGRRSLSKKGGAKLASALELLCTCPQLYFVLIAGGCFSL